MKTVEDKGDEKLLMRIRGYDLYACKAKFHSICRTAHMSKAKKGRSLNDVDVAKQNSLEKAHQETFKVIIDTITKKIIEN